MLFERDASKFNNQFPVPPLPSASFAVPDMKNAPVGDGKYLSSTHDGNVPVIFGNPALKVPPEVLEPLIQ